MTKQEQENNEEAFPDFRIVDLTREPIELFKILKFEGLVGSGGEAKAAIDAGLVSVNGEIETQRRKKIVSGSRIEFGDEKILLKAIDTSGASKESASPKPPTAPAKKAGRKAIPSLSGKPTKK